MAIKISTSQVQKTILAPVVQQSIEVLLLPLIDLNQLIEQELQNNPLLEIDEESQESQAKKLDEELRLRIRRDEQLQTRHYESNDDETMEERPITREATLEDKLLDQLRFTLSDPLKLKIGEFIIGNIDEDGYLHASIEEIAKQLEVEDLALIEEVLKIIQEFEPKGVASRTLNECLLIQAKYKANGYTELVTRIVNEHLNDLGQKRYLEIARKLGVSVERVKEAACIICSLDPKPARNYRPIASNIYIKPDIIIRKDIDDNYQILMNNDGIPALQINPFYRKMLHKSNLSNVEKAYIHEKLKNALQFMKSLEQRGQTILEITKLILKKQTAFLEQGAAALVPMTLKDVAEEIDRNESTVSRAISNKYLDTPQGLLPMKFFFSQGLSDNKEGNISNRSVKEEIKFLVQDENKRSPLSDQDIQNHFTRKGMTIARRTISKYRQKLQILPSHLRKQ